jgi:cytochrome c oxidase subunit 4
MGAHDSPEEIKKETRTYLLVFAALAVLTVITVAVSYLDANHTQAVIIALVIATAKGSLVAAFFMHLISEEKFIYAVLVLTMIFFLALFALPIGTYAGAVGDQFHMDGAEPPAAEEHH